MNLSRKIQFNIVLVFLYILYWMVSGIAIKEISNQIVAYFSTILGWIFILLKPISAMTKCKQFFGVKRQDIIVYHVNGKKEIHISKIANAGMYDSALPDPWQIIKLWDKVGFFYSTFITSALYFIVVSFLTESTRNVSDWGYDWIGAYIGVFITTFGFFIGGLIGILDWLRNPMVWIYDE